GAREVPAPFRLTSGRSDSQTKVSAGCGSWEYYCPRRTRARGHRHSEERSIGVGLTPSVSMGELQYQSSLPTDVLFSALYEELHRLARRELARRSAPVTLSVTTLLHEAYLDMSGRSGAAFPDQARFMGYAARVMRGLIIDHARNRSALKRGGEFEI